MLHHVSCKSLSPWGLVARCIPLAHRESHSSSQSTSSYLSTNYIYIHIYTVNINVYIHMCIYICTYDIHSKPGLLRTSLGNGNRKVEIEPAHHWWRDLNHHVVKKEVPFGANLELEVAPIQRQWPLLARDFTVTTEPTDWNFLFHASWPEDTPISFGFWFTNDTTRQVEPAFDILSCEEPG